MPDHLCLFFSQVIGMQQYIVRPTGADLNENILSDHILEHSDLTEDMVKTSGQPLSTVLEQVSATYRVHVSMIVWTVFVKSSLWEARILFKPAPFVGGLK